MATTDETQKIQDTLDAAFAKFTKENPELADAMRVLNISYTDYLRVLGGLQPDSGTSAGNSHTRA
jgi:hypothetical protein